MNPFLIILIILFGILVWLTSAFLFKPIGKLFTKLFTNAHDSMFNEESEEKENE